MLVYRLVLNAALRRSEIFKLPIIKNQKNPLDWLGEKLACHVSRQ